MNLLPETYIGDGVTVGPDPNWPEQLRLTTGKDTIYLDPHVAQALVQYIAAHVASFAADEVPQP